MNRDRILILKSALQLAILYLPLVSLTDLIEAACPLAGFCVQALFGALLCFCALFSSSPKAAWKKWCRSIPITLLFWLFLAVTNFDVRLTNRLVPGYGNLSAGAGFALIVKFAVFTAAQGIADLLAIVCSRPLSGRLQRLRSVTQNVLLPVICALVAFAVLYLELTMPSWESIYCSLYC